MSVVLRKPARTSCTWPNEAGRAEVPLSVHESHRLDSRPARCDPAPNW